MFKTRCSKVRTGWAVAAVVAQLLAMPAMAQNIRQDVGASERINLAGQLPTLSQRIIAAKCNVNAGVATTESNAVLRISADQFGRVRDALLYGNRGFGVLGEESRPRTLQVIEALNAAWAPLLETAGEATANPAQVSAMAEQSAPILDTATVLVSEITGQYADPVTLLHADALLIDLAGRQRLLAAKMSKDVCLIASGIAVEESTTELTKSIKLFDDTLSALRNGLESVGVRPPPTPRIEEGLQFVVEEWADIQPELDGALTGSAMTDAARERLFFAFLGMEARMNNVVVLYGQNSKF